MPCDPKFAERAAEQFVRELEITSLPVDPIDIAENRLNIPVTAKPASSGGVSGMLFRLGEEYAIAYATHITSEGFQRFSVAHEIGHYKLPGHPEHVFAGGKSVHESHAGFNADDPYEREADHFAACLLMPSHLFSKEIRRVGDGLDAVEELSGICKTSLEATAIRYVTLLDVPAAVLRTEGQQIDYCFMSQPLKDIDGLEWIRKQTVVPAGTATERFNSNPVNVNNANRVDDTTTLSDWFGGKRQIEFVEEVQGLGSYGRTLTLLYAPDGLDDEEIDEEDELDESYEVRFRRQ